MTSAPVDMSLEPRDLTPSARSDVADPITDALKRIHDDVLDEPMPDSFLTLVAQIEAKILDRKA